MKVNHKFVVENIEDLERLLPHSFPRKLEEKENSVGGTIALVLGAISFLSTVVSSVLTYLQRKKRAFVYAQIEFVVFLLFGLFLVSISAITSALRPNNTTCITTVWLVNIGYSFELVPLVVKIAAINKLMQAAKKMRRIQLSKKDLFRVMAAITGLVIIFMIVWTVVDPPSEKGDYHLTDEINSDGSTIVTVGYSCCSESGAWSIVSVGFQALLLLCASLLAFMTRKMNNDLNETTTIAFLIYWNFVCVLLRTLLVFLQSSIGATAQNISLSVILSIDTFASIMIYFVPKFRQDDEPRASVTTYSSKYWSQEAHASRKFSMIHTNNGLREFVQEYPYDNESDGKGSRTDKADDEKSETVNDNECMDPEVSRTTTDEESRRKFSSVTMTGPNLNDP